MRAGGLAHPLLAAILALCCALPDAAAQVRPQIPNSEMPGRERERFFDPFRRPDELRNDPGLRQPKPRGERSRPGKPPKRRLPRKSR